MLTCISIKQFQNGEAHIRARYIYVSCIQTYTCPNYFFLIFRARNVRGLKRNACCANRSGSHSRRFSVILTGSPAEF